MNIKPFQHTSGAYSVVAPAGFQGEPKRKFYYFETKTLANDFAKVVNNWRHARRAPQFDGTIKVEESDTAMVAFLKGAGIQSVTQLADIVGYWQRNNAVNKLGLRDAIQQFIPFFETNRKPRKSYLDDVRGKLNRFAADLAGLECHQIDRRDIIDYLGDYENNATRNQYLKRFRAFFGWAKNEQLISTDPTESIDWAKVDTKDSVEIYPAGDVRKLLQASDTQNGDSLLPWLSLQFFGFCRSEEAQQLDWSAIDFEARTITIPGSISKTHRRRVITISDQLLHWMLPYRRESGPVVPCLNGNVTKLFTAAGVTRLHNAARHTCCTVAAASLGEVVGLTRICQQAGHTPGVARKHYWEAMTPAAAVVYGEIKRG